MVAGRSNASVENSDKLYGSLFAVSSDIRGSVMPLQRHLYPGIYASRYGIGYMPLSRRKAENPS